MASKYTQWAIEKYCRWGCQSIPFFATGERARVK
jgi:hypothetical protein